MRCPKCGEDNSAVTDSRASARYPGIRRRRQCLSCHHRWSTYEIKAETLKKIWKKDSL